LPETVIQQPAPAAAIKASPTQQLPRKCLTADLQTAGQHTLDGPLFK